MMRLAAAKAKARGIPTDPALRALGLANLVLTMFLGQEWVNRYINGAGTPDQFIGPPDFSVRYWMRVVNLAEMLFNLQWVSGFEKCLAQLANGQIEDTIGEFETGKHLWCCRIPFVFNEPKNRLGFDYDLEVKARDGTWICADTKTKLETTHIRKSSLINSLETARKQLPSDRPGFIFVCVPESWASGEKIDFSLLDESIGEFFAKGSGRIASVIVHTMFNSQGSIEDLGGISTVKEYPNPRCRFKSAVGWTIFDQADHDNARWIFFRN